MSFGKCLICEKAIVFGAVVVAEVLNDEVVSFAHADCWIDSGREIYRAEPTMAAFVDAARLAGREGE